MNKEIKNTYDFLCRELEKQPDSEFKKELLGFLVYFNNHTHDDLAIERAFVLYKNI